METVLFLSADLKKQLSDLGEPEVRERVNNLKQTIADSRSFRRNLQNTLAIRRG